MQIKVENVTKKIGQATVLDQISMELESGMIYGLKGKNGSGKTMLMRMICGLILPTQGRIMIDGKTLGKDFSFPPNAGALIEAPGFLGRYSGFDNLKMLTDIQQKADDDAIAEALRKVGLDTEEKKKYKKYSLGMKQKLGIAAAIVEDPELIVLDEPTNALDEGSVERLRKILLEFKEKGALILLSSHDTEELKYLSDVIFHMENGHLKEIKETVS
ncbi:ATP-binding cassette domain-containing protein [Lachnospiraceae bacterium]|nr:ATP-binding cassette domain-containing protein [Lachnospiraceae bacterium]